ncbi:hypothetical protein ASD65_18065 [Microbacterium sp. Root61]|uniref:lipase family protein n=1 Tax=Microbacterium sp. Root61 TaxID=1736570 RepID=UPI0006FB75AD|nr:lipase family protein [Microbacterium sp. Root61]KRA22379.1 hypothetical protein ASD65_18065 [Microbacterium sp. Root61]
MASSVSDSVDAPRVRAWGTRWSALPRLLELAPPRVLLLVGIVVVGLGTLIVFRPLTSVVLLGVYVGVSAIVSGIIDLVSQRRSPRWWTTAFALLWIAGGAAVLIWLGRSLDLLPVALAALLIVGGLASLGDAVVGGRASERVLAAAWGGAQILFGILSVTWPDVTLLVVAVLFGVRTIVFGVTLVVRGGRGMRRIGAQLPGGPSFDPAQPRRAALIAAAAGRYALAAVLVAAAAGGWWLNDWLAEGAPVVDAFYDPPAQVPAAHGSLIREDAYNGRAPRYGTAQRILYTTQDALGQPAVASALVITPSDPPPGPRPVVIWNHGTTGVARGCAPSLRDASATKWAIPGLDDALSRGWVVVASDYSGQGAPGVFPYLIGAGEAHSSLDAVLAAQELPDLNLSDDVVVWGHSQGGHAALWTSQLAGEYTPQLNIAGTVAIAPVADPRALAHELTRGGGQAGGAELSVMISWVLVPYADTYSDVNIPTYVAPGARSLVREMTQRCLSEPGVIVSMLTALGVSEDQPLYPADLTDGPLGRRLGQNAATGPFPSPVLVAWGSADEVIPTTLQTRFVADQCAEGAPVRGVEYRGYSHLRTIMPGSRFLPVLMRWSAARLDGEPAPAVECG